MPEAFIGQIIAVSFKLVPKGWLACDGSLYQISAYPTLFNLLGLTYGGDGIQFAVPDLRGRIAIGQGQGPGLSDYAVGETGGEESTALLLSQIEPHRHALMSWGVPGNHPTPPTPPGPGTGYVLAMNTQTAVNMYNAGPPATTLAPSSLDVYTGRSLPHENRQPFQVINYIICSEGIYPSRG